ncbi:MAG: isopeptide-forming domain-containing fimbrial protein [Arenicellales bacterium]
MLDDPADLTDDAMVAIAGPEVEKTLIGTELDTLNNAEDIAVVIGERVFYEVRVTIPEGQTLGAILDDSLDPGLELVSIDSVEVVDQDGNAVVGALTSSEWGADFSGFAAPLVDDTDTRITYNFSDSGSSQLLLNLGNIVNTDVDNTQDEIIVINYTVMVTNDAGSEQGDIRNNAASVRFDDSGGNTLRSDISRANNVVILEPLLEVVKTVAVNGEPSTGNDNDEVNPDTALGDEGDSVTYTIVIRHTDDSDTDAYDVNFDDVIPADIVNVVLVDAIYSLDSSDLASGPDPSIVQDPSDLSGNTLITDNDFTIELDETVTITVTGEIGNSVNVGDVIDNTAEIDWTSFPETPAGTDFLPIGEEDVERGGGDSAPAGGEINDYEDQDPARIQIGANEIEKFLVNSEITDEPDATADGDLAAAVDADGVNRGAEAVIGETLSYQVVITLAEGESASALVQDSLDPGLALVSIDSIYTLQLDTSDSSISNIAAVPNLTIPGLGLGQELTTAVTAPGGIVGYTENGGIGGGDLITIDFGDIDNANDDDTILEQIVIQYTVMVRDEAANTGGGAGVPGTSLNNAAQMTWQNSAGAVQSTTPDSADPIEVIEPDLEVLKDVSVDGPGDAGDEVTYTLVIQHTGISEVDAFDVSLYDELPDQVDFSAVNFATGANVTIIDTFGTLGTADLEIDSAAGTNGALQFAATSNTSIDTTVTGSSQNTVDMPLTVTARVITITLTGVLEDSVEPGDIISNDAEINYSSLDEHNDGDPDGDDEDDRSGFVADGTEGERDYSDSDPAADITIPGPTISKELVGSDVDSSTNAEEEATIGEIVTYRVTVDVPEGSMSNAQIVDNLTPGLEFVDVVSITGMAGGSMVVSNTIDLEDPDAIGTSTSGTAASGQEITFSFGDIVATGDNNGVPPVAIDQGLDQIIIEYRVVVQDIPLNVDGAVRNNSASFQFETTNEAGDTVAQSTATVDADDITLIEPDLEIIKTVNGLADGTQAGPLDAGDLVTYTFVIQHTAASSTDAYDVNFSDSIPPELENVVLVSAISSLGAPPNTDLDPGDIALNIDGDGVITANPFTILFGEEITVTVTGEIVNAIGPGELVTNTGEIDWTSLPAGHENDGAEAERGDPTDPDDVYSDEDPAEFFTDVPEFSKGVITTSIHGDGGDGEVDLTIGEEVTFELVVTLPEGTTPVVVTDNLPPLVALAPFTGDTDGVLEVVGAEVSFVGAGIIASSTGLAQGDDESSTNITVNDISGDGFDDQVIFDFGVVEVDGNNVIAVDDNVIRVTVTAVVKNLPGTGGAINENGDELTNEATLNFAADPANPGPGQVLIDDATVDIIEPELEIDKEFIDPLTGTPIIATVTPGDTVRIRLEVTNVGTANAYDIAVLDSYNADQPVFENPADVTVPAGFTYAADDAGTLALGDDEVSFTSGSGVFIAPGATLVFEFDVDVTEDEIGVGALEGLTVANTATVTGDSLNGDNPEERDTEDDDTDILFGDPDLEKSIISTSIADTGSGQFDGSIEDVTIGETVTYQLLITLPETDLNNNGMSELSELVTTTLTDNLPDNLDLVSASVVSIGSDITMSNFVGGETLSDPDIIGAPGDASVTFNLGDIAVIDELGDGILTQQQVVIEVTAIVKNDPLNIADADKINVATLNYGGEEFEDSATVEIVEPELEITKNFLDPATGQPIFSLEAGEDVLIELVIENTGSSVAYDVSATDDLTPNIPSFFDSGSATAVLPIPPGFTFDAAGDVVTFSGGTLASGASVTLSFTVTISAGASLASGSFVDNTASVLGDTLPPGDPNETEQRVTTDDDTDQLSTPGIAKAVVDSSHSGTGDGEFTVGTVDLTVGEVVTYEVTVTIPNTFDDSDLTLVGTSVIDTLPVGFALLDARVVAIGGNTTSGATSGGEFVDSASPLVTGGPASTFLGVGDSLMSGSANITGVEGGSSVTFDFGGLAVNDANSAVGAEQTIVVQIDAVVTDDLVNNSEGATRTNSASLLWEEIPGDPVELEATAEVDIVAPELEIEKFFIDPSTGGDAFIVEAGDQLIASLEVTNNGSANAYDVLVEDEIDLTNWTIVGPVTTPPGFVYSLENGANPTPADTVTYTMSSSGDATNPDNFVAPGETVIFEFTLEYTGAAGQTTQIVNTAEVVGDSLPDDEIVVIPGIDTERSTEDDGSDVLYEGPQLDKAVFSTSVPDTGSSMFDSFEDLTIGETVTYQLVITLPETDMDGDDAIDPLTELVSTTITDSLPVNLTLVDAVVISVGMDVVTSNFTGTGLESLVGGDPDITGPAGGLSVTFDLGDVGVLDQNGNADLTEQQVIVQVTAIVTNDPANVEEDPADPASNDKENIATLNFGTEVLQDTATVEIVEPVLEITKNFLDALTGQPIFAVEAGETVRISIEVENAGSATAYDVLVTDDLNSNIPDYIVAGSASLFGPLPAGFVFDETGDVITFSGGTISAGELVTLSFNITLADPIALDPNEVISNTSDVTGNSLPPSDPNADEQRTTTDEDEDELYGLPAIIKEVADNYDDVPPGDADFEATSHAGTDDSQFDTTLPDLTIGEVVTYEVTVVIPNTFDDPNLTTIATSITDTLPVGLGLIDARVVAIGGNRSAGATEGGELVNDTNAAVTVGPASSGLAVGNSLAAGSANISGTVGGSSVTFDFGGLAVNDLDGAVGDEQTIVVQIDAVVLDDASNAAGDVKVNSAQLIWEETAGDPIVIEDDAEIEIVEPELEITKSFIDPATGVDVYTVGEGDQVVAVLNVTNNGSANVYDVLVTDEIDLVNWIIISEQVTPPGFIYSVEDGVNAVPADTVTYTMNSSLDAANPDNFVAPGETVTIEFILQYTGADDGGAQIDNTAEATGNSLPANEVLVVPGLDTVRDTEDEGSDFVYEDPGLEKVVIEGLNPDTGSEQHDPALVDLNIGEQVTYELTITLPESLLDASGAMIPVTVNLIDDLPGGFTVVGAEITGIGSAVTAADLALGNTLTVLDPVTLGLGVPAATDDPDISSADVNFPAPAVGDGFDDQVLFSFGGVTVDDVDNLALQTITVRVTAVVMDVEPENIDGEVRTNDATLEFFGTPTGDPANPFDEIVPIEITDSADVEIVEPELEIEKTFLNAAGTAEVESVTSGDTITVQLTVTNTGTGPAYDLVIEDPLDPTKFNISTISPVSTPAAFMFSLSGNSVIYTLDSGAGTPGSPAHVVTPGESVVLTFTVQVLEGIGPDTALNTATVDGDSAPGDNPFERDEPTKEGTDELAILAVPLPPSISPPSQGLTGLEDTGDSETLADQVLRTYRYDIFDRLRDEYDELFEQIRRDLQTELPKLSANYMATGITEHGSNVTLIVYDETGAIVGYSSTLADTAGNWAVSFPQTVLDKSPHHVEVQVSAASYNESTAGEFNTRIYFTPATDARVAHYKGLQVGDVIAERADSLLESMHQGNQTPFGSPGANWNHPYEFLGTASIENL